MSLRRRDKNSTAWDLLLPKEKKLLSDIITKDEPLFDSVSRYYKRPKQKLEKIYREPFFRNAWVGYMEDHGLPLEKLLAKVNSLLFATKDVVRWDKDGNKQIHKAPDNTTRIAAARMLLDRAAPIEKNVNIKHQSLKVNVNANVDTEGVITKLKFIESRIKELDESERREGIPAEGIPAAGTTTRSREAEGAGDEGFVHVQQGMSGIQGDDAGSASGVVQIRNPMEEQQEEEIDTDAAGNVQVELHNDGDVDMGNTQES